MPNGIGNGPAVVQSASTAPYCLHGPAGGAGGGGGGGAVYPWQHAGLSPFLILTIRQGA